MKLVVQDLIDIFGEPKEEQLWKSWLKKKKKFI
jgi:hypothetical protein